MAIVILDILQSLADIIGAIVTFLKPIVAPIGSFMVSWINFALSFFPTESWLIYIIIFAVLIISGIIVNSYWPGDKPLEEEAEGKLEEPKIEEDEEPDTMGSLDAERKEHEEEPAISEDKDTDSEKRDKTPIM